MDLYFDLPTGTFVSGPGTRDRVETLYFKRGDTCQLNVRFVSGIVVQELAGGATGQIGLKEAGKYDADFVASDGAWTKTGTTTTTVYTFNLNLATAEINALLGHNADDSDDVATVSLMMEMEFLADGVTTSSPTLTAIVQNDVIKGVESGATEVSAGVPVNQVTAVHLIGFGYPPSDGETLIITCGAVVETVIFKDTPTEPNHVTTAMSAVDARDNFVAEYDVSTIFTVGAVDGNGYVPLTAIVPGAAGDFAFSGTAFGPGNDIVEESGAVAGVTATPGVLGSMKLADDVLYIVSSVTDSVPFWQKTTLSDL